MVNMIRFIEDYKELKTTLDSLKEQGFRQNSKDNNEDDFTPPNIAVIDINYACSIFTITEVPRSEISKYIVHMEDRWK